MPVAHVQRRPSRRRDSRGEQRTQRERDNIEARSRREQRGWSAAKAKAQGLRSGSGFCLSRSEAARREQAQRDSKKREAVVKRVRAAGPVNNERTASPGQLAGGGCGYFSSNRRVSSAMNVLMSLN